MGRRMIEAGARFVTVAWDSPAGTDGWDSHNSSEHLQKWLIPGFDQAYTALLEDLDQRGLLAETLVVALGEMGRTPAASKGWGRGHWSYCFPALLAGRHSRRHHLRSLGRRRRLASRASRQPEDLAATIYTALGLDPHMTLPDRQGRPNTIVDGGRPLLELFS
jgi:uncharacterized protein (DUF1501 family)